MRGYTRREALKLGSLLALGLGLDGTHADAFADGVEKLSSRQAKILWLQGLSCTGCSVSLLNAESPDIVEILTQILSLAFHSNVSAAQGDDVLRVIDELAKGRDYYVVFEGAVPTLMPKSCVIGGRTLDQLLVPVLTGAKAVIAAGTCAAFGGVPAAEGNPTGAVSIGEFMRRQSIPMQNRLVNCPGCPMHPECLVGTVSYVIGRGYPRVNPELLTPEMFFSKSVHDECPRFHSWERGVFAGSFGEDGCLFKLGCLGPLSRTACPRRQWNGGVNWCIRAGAPCLGCTNDQFAKRRDFPFYRKGESYHLVNYTENDRKGTTA